MIQEQGRYMVRLTRVRSKHQNIRTDEVVGVTWVLPIVEHPFRMVGAPLNPNADARLVFTTRILSLEYEDGVYIFNTANSTYQLEVLDEA